MRVTVEVLGDVQLDRSLLRFADRAQDMEPAFGVLADDFLGLNRRQFSSEGGNSGGWAELAPSTVAERIRQGFPGPHPILHRTGDLEESLTVDGSKGSVRTVSPDELFVGTDVQYAHYHQTGTARMPRRRPVEFTRSDRDRWVKVLQRYLVTGEAGL